MGINPTQANFKSFTFDGENSRNYGVYITGQGVFNAPERNVEMVEIPGRNGAYALDKGTFNNIEVTYPAGIFADTETDFAEAVSDLRNFLCSRVGYVRLEDDYNPNEYRLAIYKSGLDVEHDFLIAGEFELVFECKPQRYLKSGETAISVTSGDTITNPTLFDAKSELQVNGYGNIKINDSDIDIENILVGDVSQLVSPAVDNKANIGNQSYNFLATFPSDLFANGDTVKISETRYSFVFHPTTGNSFNTNTLAISDETNCICTMTASSSTVSISVRIPSYDITIGTSSTNTSSFKWTYSVGLGSVTVTITMSTAYNKNTGGLTYRWAFSSSPTNVKKSITTRTGTASGNSTMTIPDAIHIDLDIGEVWATIMGEMTVLNDVAQLPAELPVLASGANTITYDNTYTQVKIVPRWWKV